MMKKNVVINEAKFEEFKAIRKVVNETIKPENRARMCLNNPTLRKMAGYDGQEEEVFNPLVKDMLDKYAYDEHDKKVKEARENEDVESLKRLSNVAMRNAGYIKDENSSKILINDYFKCFVDRTLIKKHLDKLYISIQKNDQEGIDSAYRNIYQMTSYSSQRPFGVINECAQGFVDSRLSEFEERGIYVPENQETQEKYAI